MSIAVRRRSDPALRACTNDRCPVPSHGFMRRNPGIVLLLVTLSGCVERSAGDDGVWITWAWWVKALAVFGCVVAAVLGAVLRRPKWRFTCLALAVLGAALVVPSVWRESLHVGNTGVRFATGLWVTPRVHEVRFADATGVLVPPSQFMDEQPRPVQFRLRSGATVAIPQGDMVSQCLDDIADAARKAGVVVMRGR